MSKKWWDSSIGYIIYPESFKDSNGDGIGDLNGIYQKLDYLAELGVNLIWICPIFASPMDDNGYDVSSYYDINPLFGTNEDFRNLLDKAHRLGIKILIDLVINHTSSEHPWFKKAVSNLSSKEAGYYYFEKGIEKDGKLLPPNNWASFFGESAWSNIEGTSYFYLHIFSSKMPDVNWNNPELREEYYEIARHYLDMGVDGFRLDAIAHLGKDLSFASSDKPADLSGYVLDPSKFSNREEMYGFLLEFKNKVFSKYDCLTIGEAGGEITPKDCLRLVDKDNGSINMAFNFDTVWVNGAYGSIDKKDEEIKTDVITLKDNFKKWYDICHERASMPLYWANHDHPRVLSQYGSVKYRSESAKCLLTTLLFMYGTPFIYQGDEIGMSNVNFTNVEDFYEDVGSKNLVKNMRSHGYSDDYIAHYLCRTSRINARTPMQWDDSINAGFSNKPGKIKINENYKQGVNVYEEMCDPYSILNFYQYAISKRKSDEINSIITNGKFDLLDRNHPDVFAYKHELGNEKLIVISNFRDHDVYFSFYWRIKDVLLHNYEDVILKDHVFKLRPFETFLLKV